VARDDWRASTTVMEPPQRLCRGPQRLASFYFFTLLNYNNPVGKLKGEIIEEYWFDYYNTITIGFQFL
jgi:hypothetical protein